MYIAAKVWFLSVLVLYVSSNNSVDSKRSEDESIGARSRDKKSEAFYDEEQDIMTEDLQASNRLVRHETYDDPANEAQGMKSDYYQGGNNRRPGDRKTGNGQRRQGSGRRLSTGRRLGHNRRPIGARPLNAKRRPSMSRRPSPTERLSPTHRPLPTERPSAIPKRPLSKRDKSIVAMLPMRLAPSYHEAFVQEMKMCMENLVDIPREAFRMKLGRKKRDAEGDPSRNRRFLWGTSMEQPTEKNNNEEKIIEIHLDKKKDANQNTEEVSVYYEEENSTYEKEKNSNSDEESYEDFNTLDEVDENSDAEVDSNSTVFEDEPDYYNYEEDAEDMGQNDKDFGFLEENKAEDNKENVMDDGEYYEEYEQADEGKEMETEERMEDTDDYENDNEDDNKDEEGFRDSVMEDDEVKSFDDEDRNEGLRRPLGMRPGERRGPMNRRPAGSWTPRRPSGTRNRQPSGRRATGRPGRLNGRQKPVRGDSLTSETNMSPFYAAWFEMQGWRCMKKSLEQVHVKTMAAGEIPLPDEENTSSDKGSGEGRPNPVGDRPRPDSQRPKPGGGILTPGDERYSKPGQLKPTYDGGKPGPGQGIPSSDRAKPRQGGQRPKPGQDRPFYEKAKPIPDAQRPKSGQDRPFYGKAKPIPGAQRPKSGQGRQGTGEVRRVPADQFERVTEGDRGKLSEYRKELPGVKDGGLLGNNPSSDEESTETDQANVMKMGKNKKLHIVANIEGYLQDAEKKKKREETAVFNERKEAIEENEGVVGQDIPSIEK